MGAVPSREAATASLSQVPFYGQRQNIVLVPLLKEFFPDADCALTQQLYDARCDPAVRYYHHTNEFTGVAINGSSNSKGINNNDKIGACDGEGQLNTLSACDPPDVFPRVNFSRSDFYKAYVQHGAEELVYETDAEMLEEYQKDPRSVRPLPCAVTFLYHRSDSDDTTAAAAVNGTAPEDCVDVLGWKVKVTGFIGDTSMFLSLTEEAGRRKGLHDNLEVDMFLTKSAGDHNRTHVLISAIYAYAEQWQRACLHYAASTGVSSDICRKPDASLLTQQQQRLSVNQVVERTPRGNSSAFSLAAAAAAAMSASMPFVCKQLAAKTSTTYSAEGSAASSTPGRTGTPGAEPIYWMPPPLPEIRISTRRCNVPLLCFLREIRSTVLSMRVHQRAAAVAALSEEVTNSAAACTCAEQATSLTDLVMWLEDVLVYPPTNLIEHSGVHDADSFEENVGNDQTVDAHRKKDNSSLTVAHAETFIHTVLPLHLIEPLVEHTIAFLLHNMNPLEVSLARRRERGEEAEAQAEKDSTELEGNAGGPTHVNQFQQQQQQHSTTCCGSMSAGGQCTCAHPHAIGKKVTAVRMPDEEVIVEKWPSCIKQQQQKPQPHCLSTENEMEWQTVEDLAAVMRDTVGCRRFWVVGQSEKCRQSAARAVQLWINDGLPLIVGFDGDNEAHGDEARRKFEGFIKAVSGKDNAPQHAFALLPIGTVLELFPSSNPTRPLRVGHFPLEELLLGELRDACKLAREAGPTDLHWIRSDDPAQRVYSASERMLPGIEPPPHLPEAADIAGAGGTALWRLKLANDVERVIAVTPFFLKPIRRKKLAKKKKTIPKEVLGTAEGIFFGEASAVATSVAIPTEETGTTTTTTATVQEAGEKDLTQDKGPRFAASGTVEVVTVAAPTTGCKDVSFVPLTAIPNNGRVLQSQPQLGQIAYVMPPPLHGSTSHYQHYNQHQRQQQQCQTQHHFSSHISGMILSAEMPGVRRVSEFAECPLQQRYDIQNCSYSAPQPLQPPPQYYDTQFDPEYSQPSYLPQSSSMGGYYAQAPDMLEEEDQVPDYGESAEMMVPDYPTAQDLAAQQWQQQQQYIGPPPTAVRHTMNVPQSESSFHSQLRTPYHHASSGVVVGAAAPYERTNSGVYLHSRHQTVDASASATSAFLLSYDDVPNNCLVKPSVFHHHRTTSTSMSSQLVFNPDAAAGSPMTNSSLHYPNGPSFMLHERTESGSLYPVQQQQQHPITQTPVQYQLPHTPLTPESSIQSIHDNNITVTLVRQHHRRTPSYFSESAMDPGVPMLSRQFSTDVTSVGSGSQHPPPNELLGPHQQQRQSKPHRHHPYVLPAPPLSDPPLACSRGNPASNTASTGEGHVHVAQAKRQNARKKTFHWDWTKGTGGNTADEN